MRKVVVILLNHELQFVIYCFRTSDNWFCSQTIFFCPKRSQFFWRVSANFPNFSFFGARFFYFFYFFFRPPEKKICVISCAKKVNDRKISKTDLDSCDTEVLSVDKNGGVARAICSQEHLPSFLFFGHYAKNVSNKKSKQFLGIHVIIRCCKILFSMT